MIQEPYPVTLRKWFNGAPDTCSTGGSETVGASFAPGPVQAQEIFGVVARRDGTEHR